MIVIIPQTSPTQPEMQADRMTDDFIPEIFVQ